MSRKVVVVNQSLASTSSFVLNLQQRVGFLPKSVIVRQLIYSNIAGADFGTYLIWSDLTWGHIGAVYMGIQGIGMMPMTTIPFTSPQQAITFRIEKANAAFPDPSGQLTMVLEFVQEEGSDVRLFSFFESRIDPRQPH